MKIVKLEKEVCESQRFVVKYSTTGYYDIERKSDAFSFFYRPFKEITNKSFEFTLFDKWLDEPVAYGAFEKNILLGVAEGSPEKWNNRFRISNICVFEQKNRRSGIGGLLMNQMVAEAKQSGARMVVLETQSCNEKAIAFYKKYGFSMIGFDLYAYSNTDPERHEIRIEMGMAL